MITARYRVEYRSDGEPQVLGWLRHGFPHHSTLDPFVSWLTHTGATTGEVVLIEQATGTTVARRHVARQTRRTRLFPKPRPGA